MRRRTAITASVSVALALAAWSAMLAARPPDRSPRPRDEVFEISGSVEPVYPLVGTPFTLHIENSRSVPILVTRLVVEVGDASGGCAADNLEIDPVTLPLEVPRYGEIEVMTTARLVDDADDACKAATFPLTFVGSATRP